jgi:hypothetical protein
VQQYLPSVESAGERALIWIAGELTHAVAKHPRFAGHDERVAAAPPPSEEEQSLAHAALRRWSDRILYGRVDVMRDQEGRAVLSELELIEPSLYFDQCPGTARRFVERLGRL